LPNVKLRATGSFANEPALLADLAFGSGKNYIETQKNTYLYG